MRNYGRAMVQQKNGLHQVRRPNAPLATVSPAVEIHKPRTKMFFLKRWWNQFILRSVQQANRDSDNSKEVVAAELGNQLDTNPLRLHIYYGSGGIAIETKYYDRRREEHTTQLYVVPESANLTEELERILTMENLRRA